MSGQTTPSAAHDCCHSAASAGAEVSANRSDVDSKIDALETRIGEIQREVAELRRSRPAEPVRDYEFQAWTGERVRLSSLAHGRPDLIVVHNMGVACSYCTMWADGFVGLLPHLESRAAFVVTSPDPIEVQQRFARKRGWNFRMVSANGSAFFHDMGFTDSSGDPMPGVSVFHCASGGPIRRVQRAEFAPGDAFCPVWHFFDLLAGGVQGWEPRHQY